jgi:hypothetical protein
VYADADVNLNNASMPAADAFDDVVAQVLSKTSKGSSSVILKHHLVMMNSQVNTEKVKVDSWVQDQPGDSRSTSSNNNSNSNNSFDSKRRRSRMSGTVRLHTPDSNTLDKVR